MHKCNVSVLLMICSLLSCIITVSGAEVSDSCSLASSGYGSSEADIGSIFGSSHSKDASLISRFKSGVLKILNNVEFTPPLNECLLFYLELSTYTQSIHVAFYKTYKAQIPFYLYFRQTY